MSGYTKSGRSKLSSLMVPINLKVASRTPRRGKSKERRTIKSNSKQKQNNEKDTDKLLKTQSAKALATTAKWAYLNADGFITTAKYLVKLILDHGLSTVTMSKAGSSELEVGLQNQKLSSDFKNFKSKSTHDHAACDQDRA